MIDHSRERKEFAEYLNQWKWDWHLTYRFYKYQDQNAAFEFCSGILNYLRRALPTARFAGLMLYTNPDFDNPHVHTLLISDPRYPKTLLSSGWRTFGDPKSIAQIYLAHVNIGSYAITDSGRWSQEDVCRYLAKKKNFLLEKPDQWDIKAYRPALLEKLKCNHNFFPDNHIKAA